MPFITLVRLLTAPGSKADLLAFLPI